MTKGKKIFSRSISYIIAAAGVLVILLPFYVTLMKRHIYYKIIYGVIVLGMFVPFQVIMVPLVQFMGSLGLSNKFGLILLHVTYAAMQGYSCW